MAGRGPKKMGKRKRDRVLPREAVEAPLYKQAQKPVPADVFRASVVVYQAAAKMTMPAVNPEEYKIGIEGSVYALSDNPMNRGMLAVKEFLKPGNQSDLFPSITVRLMSLLSAMSTMRADAKYARFFKPDLTDQSYLVSEALFDGFALASLLPQTMDVDLDDVLRIAIERHDADPPD